MSEPSPTETVAAETAPFLQVVRGTPTPAELAALVTALSALSAAGPDAAGRRPRPEWNAPHRLVRAPHRHGAGAWRGSALPR